LAKQLQRRRFLEIDQSETRTGSSKVLIPENMSILVGSLTKFDKPFRKDRNRFGGGVLVYVSTTLKVKRRVDLEYDNHEFIWLLSLSNRIKINRIIVKDKFV
jgi:hypothetical protein